MRISQRAQSVAPFYAMEFGKHAAALEAQGHHVVKLSLGEPDFGAPPAVVEAMRTAMDGRPMSYTEALGMPSLRQAIAGFYGERHGVDVDPGRVVVTAGASAALVLGAAALVDAGDEVLIGDPSYPCNRQIMESFGARVTLVPTSAASRFQLDAESVRSHWTDGTRGIMVATPSNPTGTSIPEGELAALCDLARERDAWRIVDEIYLDLGDHDDQGRPPRSALAYDPDAVVINSFSKYFGMTGWRLGWCVVPEILVPALERLAQNYFLCASTPAQHAALACFTPTPSPSARSGAPSSGAGARSSSTAWHSSDCRCPCRPTGRSTSTSTSAEPGSPRGSSAPGPSRRRMSRSPRGGTSGWARRRRMYACRTRPPPGNCAKGSPAWGSSSRRCGSASLHGTHTHLTL